jgi:cell division protein FtsW (lipid II flippase)
MPITKNTLVAFWIWLGLIIMTFFLIPHYGWYTLIVFYGLIAIPFIVVFVLFQGAMWKGADESKEWNEYNQEYDQD